MNWYKLAQENLSQWELKSKLKPLQEQYGYLFQKQWKNTLSQQEIETMEKISKEMDYLGEILDKKIKEQTITSEELISKGKEHEVRPSNFLNYHYTGSISPTAYETYLKKEGISWLGTYEEYPVLVKKDRYGNEIIEFRRNNDEVNYVKKDDNGDIVRNEKGLAINLTEKEKIQKGLPLKDPLIVAFNEKKEPIGLASDEFGADGIWVVEDYQKRGIGTDLLYELRKQFPHKRKIGQMTESGINLTKKYHKKLIEEALKRGENVPEDILKEYGII